MCLSRRIDGAVAQLGERGLCKPEVVGSNPISSTIAPEKRGELREDLELLESDRTRSSRCTRWEAAQTQTLFAE